MPSFPFDPTAPDVIATAWAQTETMMVPAWASSGQRQDMRAAFYAGVQVVLGALDHISGLEENDGVNVLEKLHQEMRAYVATLSPPGTVQ